MDHREYVVEEEEGGMRLDGFLSQREDLSRSSLQTLIDDGQVLVNGTIKKKSYRLSKGDTISLQIPPLKDPSPLPQDLPLTILYEDDSLLVINKEAGIVVHPAPGHHHGTLVNALLFHVPDLAGINGVKRPGIVHRLDKDTSGVMVVAKGDHVHQHLKEQFTSRVVKKTYLTFLEGSFPYENVRVEAPIGRNPYHRQQLMVTKKNSKWAVSHFWVKRRFPTTTLLKVSLETGRMHQIRVHARYLGHPVVGDTLYSKGRRDVPRQLLHSFSLAFIHPQREEWMEFKAPLPGDFLAFLRTQREAHP